MQAADRGDVPREEQAKRPWCSTPTVGRVGPGPSTWDRNYAVRSRTPIGFCTINLSSVPGAAPLAGSKPCSAGTIHPGAHCSAGLLPDADGGT